PTPIPSGEWPLFVEAAPPLEGPSFLRVEGPLPADFDLRCAPLRAGDQLAGLVRGSEGRAAAGVLVEVLDAGGRAFGWARSGAEGRFLLYRPAPLYSSLVAAEPVVLRFRPAAGEVLTHAGP